LRHLSYEQYFELLIAQTQARFAFFEATVGPERAAEIMAEQTGQLPSYNPISIGGLEMDQFFDETLYLQANPDIFSAVRSGALASGYDHFVAVGITEGRDPGVLYDEAYYLAQNPDVAAAIAAGVISSGLQHFVFNGHREGRDPIPEFDQSDYLVSNPDVAAAVQKGHIDSAFSHYLSFGADEGRGPDLSLYSEAFYLRTNPDVAAAVNAGVLQTGFDHFVSMGQIEARRPSPGFNEQAYLAANPNVTNVLGSDFTSGFSHYALVGRVLGITPSV
jgi:hypothetical protein